MKVYAEEVARQLPTTVAVAGTDHDLAMEIQEIFFTDRFRVYTNEDLAGVELGGALKNIIALGAGISDGLGFGDNAKAAMMTRGITEMTRLGLTMGADMKTFSGLTGIGDLVVTCTSRHSRNHRCGLALGQGKKLDQILEEMGMVVEGVKTTRATVELARQMGISMPIAEMMYRVLFEDFPVQQAVSELMCRNRKSEREKEMLGV